MLYTTLKDPYLLQPLRANPLWNFVFQWLDETMVGLLPTPGEYHIHDSGIRAIVSVGLTKPLSDAKPEAHQKNFDVHYCISGAEQIDYALISHLQVDQAYDEDTDTTLFTLRRHKIGGRVILTPGTLAIFEPTTAHAPGLHIGYERQSEITKVVVKFPVGLHNVSDLSSLAS